MNKSWIIATRELKERLQSKSFLMMAVLGPILILVLTYFLFAMGGNHKRQLKVLIADPAGIMENKIMAKEDASIKYFFANDYLEIEEFKEGKRFQEYDALLEVNEKILSNKSAFLFYREKPSNQVIIRLHYQFERRIEEVIIQEFSKLSLEKFRELKQPINLSFRNVYDPKNEEANLGSWVGYFFGSIIVLFVFLFGMTILRSVSKEKSNRIVEVMLASIQPRQLMLGKIIGIGLAALLQFVIWVSLIAIGLFLMRETLFPDLFDAANMNVEQMTEEVKNLTYQERMFSAQDYNYFVELIYERIQFSNMLFYFLLFFVVAYLFYASFFVSLGALSGSESDGQQFVIPLVFILLLSLYAGYFVVQNPASSISFWFSMLPFTSPIVCMVKLAQGYTEGTSYQLYVSLVILVISAYLFLGLANRFYQNGILQFGHRLRLKHLLKWMKRA
jgi:ABC-2 type transport system permease protein